MSPELPLTMREYCELHRVSRITVRRWIDKGRIPATHAGGGERRSAAVLIWTTERPPRLTPRRVGAIPT